MPRAYAKVSTTIHRSKRFRALHSDDARFAYLMILASPRGNSIGAFALEPDVFATELRWTPERLDAALADLSTAHTDGGALIEYDDDEGEVVVVDYLKHDPIFSPDHLARAWKLVGMIKSDRLRAVAKAMVENAAENVSGHRGGRPRNRPSNTPVNTGDNTPVTTPVTTPVNTGDNTVVNTDVQQRQKSAILKTPVLTGVVTPTEHPPNSTYTDTDSDTYTESTYHQLQSPTPARASPDAEGGDGGGGSISGESMRAVIRAFDDAVAELWGENHRRPNPAHRDGRTALEMLLAASSIPGLDPVDAVSIAIDECLTGKHRSGDTPPTTLRYCLPAVIRAMERAASTMTPEPPPDPTWAVAFKRFGNGRDPRFAPIDAILKDKTNPSRFKDADVLAARLLAEDDQGRLHGSTV